MLFLLKTVEINQVITGNGATQDTLSCFYLECTTSTSRLATILKCWAWGRSLLTRLWPTYQVLMETLITKSARWTTSGEVLRTWKFWMTQPGLCPKLHLWEEFISKVISICSGSILVTLMLVTLVEVSWLIQLLLEKSIMVASSSSSLETPTQLLTRTERGIWSSLAVRTHQLHTAEIKTEPHLLLPYLRLLESLKSRTSG